MKDISINGTQVKPFITELYSIQVGPRNSRKHSPPLLCAGATSNLNEVLMQELIPILKITGGRNTNDDILTSRCRGRHNERNKRGQIYYWSIKQAKWILIRKRYMLKDKSRNPCPKTVASPTVQPQSRKTHRKDPTDWPHSSRHWQPAI